METLLAQDEYTILHFFVFPQTGPVSSPPPPGGPLTFAISQANPMFYSSTPALNVFLLEKPLPMWLQENCPAGGYFNPNTLELKSSAPGPK